MAAADAASTANAAAAPDVNVTASQMLLRRILLESNNDTWWMMPDEPSFRILEEWRSAAARAPYDENWNGIISRCTIDFTTIAVEM